MPIWSSALIGLCAGGFGGLVEGHRHQRVGGERAIGRVGGGGEELGRLAAQGGARRGVVLAARPLEDEPGPLGLAAAAPVAGEEGEERRLGGRVPGRGGQGVAQRGLGGVGVGGARGAAERIGLDGGEPHQSGGPRLAGGGQVGEGAQRVGEVGGPVRAAAGLRYRWPTAPSDPALEPTP